MTKHDIEKEIKKLSLDSLNERDRDILIAQIEKIVQKSSDDAENIIIKHLISLLTDTFIPSYSENGNSIKYHTEEYCKGAREAYENVRRIASRR